MRKISIIILLSFVLLFPLKSLAQLIACRDSVKNGYEFWLYVPEGYDAPNSKKPVIIFLHGRSLCGTDLNSVRSYGCIDALERGRAIDAFVIAPQTQGVWKPDKVMEIYDWVKNHYPVDTNRLYVLGMSLGGYGTLDFVASYPDRVAAAIAMCGGSTAKELCGLNEVPLWIIHGTADKAVPIRCSQQVVDAMTECGDTTRLIFDKLKGVNHSRLNRVFYLEQTYEWLFSHSLTDSARMTNKEFSISNALMAEAFADLDKPFTLNVIDSKGTSHPYRPKNYYVVQKGDTLSKIAVEHGTTVSILCKMNKIRKTDKLRVGKRLRIS